MCSGTPILLLSSRLHLLLLLIDPYFLCVIFLLFCLLCDSMSLFYLAVLQLSSSFICFSAGCAGACGSCCRMPLACFGFLHGVCDVHCLIFLLPRPNWWGSMGGHCVSTSHLVRRQFGITFCGPVTPSHIPFTSGGVDVLAPSCQVALPHWFRRLNSPTARVCDVDRALGWRQPYIYGHYPWAIQAFGYSSHPSTALIVPH